MPTDLYCVMGHPVAHSQSPWIHTRFAELTGQDLHYTRREVPLDAFTAQVGAFIAEGGRGCNVTVPFKFEAAALADEVSARGALAQACNTLAFRDGTVWGDNTDGIGLVQDITQNAGVALHGQRVLLVGAGGAAAGVLGPLIETQPAQICVTNRTESQAHHLVNRHHPLATQCGVMLNGCGLSDVGAAFDVVINATTSSLAGHSVPVPGHVLRPGALAYDMMYGPAAQGFMQWATRHGALARDGLGMLVGQAAHAFALWRGVMPPAAQVLAELRQRLNNPAPAAP